MRESAEHEMARIRTALETGRQELAKDRITTPQIIVRTAG
jgi:hypothetical protein